MYIKKKINRAKIEIIVAPQDEIHQLITKESNSNKKKGFSFYSFSHHTTLPTHLNTHTHTHKKTLDALISETA